MAPFFSYIDDSSSRIKYVVKDSCIDDSEASYGNFDAVNLSPDSDLKRLSEIKIGGASTDEDAMLWKIDSSGFRVPGCENVSTDANNNEFRFEEQ